MVSKPQSADLSPSLRTQRGKPSSRRGSVDCGDTAFNCVKPEIVTWMGHGSRPLRECTIFSNNFKLICPVQPRPQKYSASRETQITPTTPAIPSREEGRWPSSQTLGRVAVDAAASGARGVRRAGFRERTSRADERRLNAFARSLVGGTGWPNGLAEEAAYGKTVWFWHPWLA